MNIDSWKSFFIAVEQMRECQKAYFRTRSPSALYAAKRCETAVDNCINDKRAERARELQPALIEE